MKNKELQLLLAALSPDTDVVLQETKRSPVLEVCYVELKKAEDLCLDHVDDPQTSMIVLTG